MGGYSVMPPTGNQTMTQDQVDNFLRDARMSPTNKSPRILGINQIPIMRAKNNGYPIHMYHASLEMRIALKEEEEMALAETGYQREYIRKEYPKALYRRNMDPKFEPQFDPATGLQTNLGFVEERTARSEAEEKTLRAMKPKAGQSEWFERFADVPPIEDGPAEDPRVTIARLEGQVSGLQKQIADSEESGEGKKRSKTN